MIALTFILDHGCEISPTVGLRVRLPASQKLSTLPSPKREHDGDYVAVASKGGAPVHPT